MGQRAETDIQADAVAKTGCPQCGQVVELEGAAPFSIVQCPQCRAKFAAPGRLGKLVLLRRLGQGEMGATYKAYEKGLGRNVAVKVMRRSLGADQRRVEDFLAEARAVAALEHPNAVRLYSVGQEKQQPYIVMELIRGGSMDKAFSADHRMAEDRALAIAIGVARALEAADEIGLVHGDVKPANIMLDEKGQPKLVDFGIARFGGAQSGGEGLVGTPYYVAPEQVRKEAVDRRADMYSLGATLYHALAGRPAFPGTTMEQVVNARLERPAPALLAARPTLHPKTGGVVARMLQTNPEDRHATYKELLEDLRQAYFQVTGLETPELEEVRARPEIPTAAPAVSRGRTIAVAGIVAVVLAAAAVGGWAVWGRGGGDGGPTPGGPDPSGQRVADPWFTPSPRTIGEIADVTIGCDTESARVRYTTDGSEPTEASRLYAGPVPVEPGMVLKARAYRDGWQPSRMIEGLYTRDTTTITDIVPLRRQAETAWKSVRDLQAGGGAAKKLEEAGTLWANAEEYYAQRAYGAAKVPYEKLLSLCGELKMLASLQRSAAEAREEAKAAERALASVGVKGNRNSPWRKASEAAGSAFEAGRYLEATDGWRGALEKAKQRLGEEARREREAYDKALGRHDASRLKAHGGKAWRDAESALRKAKEAERTGRPEEAVVLYRQARENLSKAGRAAQTGNIEAEKTRLVNEAKKLTEEGKYRQAVAKAEEALKLKPTSGSARRALDEARDKMKLTLDIGERQKVELIWVPSGRFTMGSPSGEEGRKPDEIEHRVMLTRPFYIGRQEITRKQFWVFARKANKFRTDAERLGAIQYKRSALPQLGVRRGAHWEKPGFGQRDDCPVVGVSWRDATVFCAWMSRKTGRKVRLPTEAEWEYVCRAGTASRFGFGESEGDLHKHGNYADGSLNVPWRDKDRRDGHNHTAPARKYKPNAWGVYDMHGNVREWCIDGRGGYPTRPVVDPRGGRSSRFRIHRGGSWCEPASSARSAARDGLREEFATDFIGFRVVVEMPK